ncbi:MAG: Ig-like domain-containing protein [Pseudomonadota bacterium]|nr:Ig-like domain-containing protein [Pseudomonadota bacterium]MDP1904280.1 Ig-like domain-containing protein [Pseudomonadota bacterium]MDP2351858.1 Ig-like domain-containing protein [Pseudomonadota bacterium]
MSAETKMGNTAMYSVKSMKRLLLAGMIGLSGLLAGCGGGGAGGTSGTTTPTTTVTTTLTGTAATGAAMPNTTVITVKDATGKNVTLRSSSFTGGSFTLSFDNSTTTAYTAPFILRADPNGVLDGDEHYSILLNADTTTANSYRVNITPITSLILYESTKSNLALWFDAPASYGVPSGTELIAASTIVRGKFNPQLPDIDFFGQSFSANGTDTYDAAMDTLDLVKIEFTGNTPTLKNSSNGVIPYVATTPLFPITAVTVAAGSATQIADGASFNLITATVSNATGLAKGVNINFTTTAGSIYDAAKTTVTTSAITDTTGVAKVYLKAGAWIGGATVTAESDDNAKSGSTSVQFIPGVSAVIGLSASPNTVNPGGATTLSALVLDANGNLVANGETVTFKRVVSVGPEVQIGAQATTNGYATLAYTAGNTSGTETLKAYTANGVSQSVALTVSPAASAVTSLLLTSASSTLVANGNSTTTLSATAKDSNGNGVSGASIVFSTSAGCVFTTTTCEATVTATTNSNGVATATLKSSAQVLTAVTGASVNGITATRNVSFTAGAATVVGLNAAPTAVKPGGTSTLTVSVLDNGGYAVVNEPITLAICAQVRLGCSTSTSGNPSLSAVNGTTNANGLLQVTYTAGANNGTDTVRVITSNGVVKTVNIGVNSNNAVVGSVSAAATNASIPVSTGSSIIRATVRDAAGQVMPGITVDFTASAGYLGATGTSTTASAATDANGIASVILRAGTIVLTARVEAVSNGFADIAQVNFIAGAPDAVTVTAAPTAVKPGGASALTVLVTDASGNPVAGESVGLSLKTIGSGVPSLSTLTGTTNANGIAVLTYTAGAVNGTDTVQAAASNGKTGTIDIGVDSANAVVGSISLAAVKPSIAVRDNTEMRATVLDTANQPIAGRTVSFTTSTGTFGAVSTTTTTTTAVTDANGVASVTLTAGSVVVAANISASASGFSHSTTVNFTAGAVTFVTVIPAPNAVQPSGSSTLTVLVQDNDRNSIIGENVALAISTIKSGAPSLNIASGLTNSSGMLTLTYTAGATSASLPDVITATASNGVAGTANISVNGSNAIVASVNVAATSASIPITGSTVLRATVLDTAGRAVPGISVHFDTGAGTFGGAPTTDVVTDANGVASVTLTAGSSVLTAQVRASTNGFTHSTSVNFTAGTAAAVSLNATPNILVPLGTATITVAVVDNNGNAVANEPVTLSLPNPASGTPSLSATIGTTDANGLLSVTYTAGAGTGADQVKAVVSTGFSASKIITVAAGTPTISDLIVTATNTSVPVVTGSSVIRAEVKGAGSMSGLTVNFAIRSGGGTLSASSAVTDANGMASVTLTGTTVTVAQAVRVDASVGGFNRSATVDFVADKPSAISLVAMPNAVKPGGTTTLVAAVADAEGNPMANEKVTLSIERNPATGLSPSGASALNLTTGSTSNNGLLTVTYTAGANSGVSDVIRAVTSNGLLTTFTTISVNNNNIVIGSVAVSAAKSSLVVGGDTTTIRATVLDSAGAPVPNYPVTFKTSAGNIVTPANTDINGLATATLTSGSNVLTATVTATAGGVPGTTSVGFISDVAATVAVSAAPSTVNPGVTSTVFAYVTDTGGNPVAGETVTFAITVLSSGQPTLAMTSAITNQSGLASVTYTAGAGTGTDTVSVLTSNGKTNTLDIVVNASATVVGSISLVSGATTLPADGATTATLRASVLTTSGAPASGVTVNFLTSGGSLSATSAVTNASGIAEVILTSPTRTGTVSVTANASGFLASQDLIIVAGQPVSTKFVLVASPATVNAGGISALTAIVLDANDNPVVGQTVTFTITTNTTNGALSPVTATTSSNGIATTNYTGGNVLGTDTIRAALVGGLSKTATVQVSGGTLNALAIGTSQTTVKSNNSEIATITVTALSSQSVVVPGVTITFSADGGQLSAAQVVTDAAGKASVAFTSGTQDRSNRTVTITAIATGASQVQIPVRVVDSTVALATTLSTLTAGGAGTTVTVTARDASGLGINNVPVTLSQSGTGSLTITSASGNTDVNGQFTTTVTGQTQGSPVLTATALGASASQTYTVLPGSSFGITAPTSDPASLATGGTLVFNVTAPSPANRVRFASTIGTWSVCPGGSTGASVCIATAAGSATATLTSANTGIASVQVDGLDASGNVTGSDTHTVAITSAVAASISLQASAASVQPSTGGTSNTVTLIATLRDAGGQPVGNVPVAFSLANTTGGGESVSPVIKLSSDGVTSTDPLGQARAVFTSGSLPSGQSASSIQVRATVVGTAFSATVNIVVGGTAGSVVIGQATHITDSGSTTQYTYPMSVLVADSNGNPVPAGTVVSLSVWPTSYSKGVWLDAGTNTTDGLECAISITSTAANEDANENLVLDTGEDTNSDGSLTPGNSTGGTLPSSVVTDANGVANFNLTYLKSYAGWITVRIGASTQVQGSEATSQVVFRLPWLRADSDACLLSPSPFN